MPYQVSGEIQNFSDVVYHIIYNVNEGDLVLVSITPSSGNPAYYSAVYYPNMTQFMITEATFGDPINGAHSYQFVATTTGNYVLKTWTNSANAFNYTVRSSNSLSGISNHSPSPTPSLTPPPSLSPSTASPSSPTPSPTQNPAQSPTPTSSLATAPPSSTFSPSMSTSPAQSSQPTPAGLVSFWKCEEGSGTVLTDSADSNNGVINGAAFSSGPSVGLGNALQFDGSSIVKVADSPTLKPLAMTVEAWIYLDQLPPSSSFPPSASSQYDIVSKYSYNPDYGFVLHVVQNKVEFVVGNGAYSGGDLGGWIWAETTTNLKAGQWYHVAGTYDGNSVTIYLNGLQDGAKTIPSGYTFAVSDRSLGIGGHYDGDVLEKGFKGRIDEIAFYDRALSSQEIAAQYTNSVQGIDYNGAATPTPVSSLSSSFTSSSNPTPTPSNSSPVSTDATSSVNGYLLLAGIIVAIAVPLLTVAFLVRRKRKNKLKLMSKPIMPKSPLTPTIKSSNHVFIIHVHADSKVALEIADGIEKEGYRTWYYERDRVAGISYLLQTKQAIEQSQAVIILISPDSLGSSQITVEVIRAHEAGKPFIPLLKGISHLEFQHRQPEWQEAMAAHTSIDIPKQGVSAIMQNILNGLEGLGVKKKNELNGQKKQDS
jgi:hypothetical protein